MKNAIRQEILTVLDALRAEGWNLASDVAIGLERPKQPEHGDLATNVALAVGRGSGRKPREIAEELARRLNLRASEIRGALESATVAGPGFINLRVRPEAIVATIDRVFAAGDRFGRSSGPLPGRTLIEFVSANPTGPLHIAHARGAVVGDALVRSMRAAGHEVSTEYYVNDAGQKVINLAWTVRLLVHGQPLWSEAYRGEYVRRLADAVKASHPELVAEPMGFVDPAAPADKLQPLPQPSDRALAAVCVARQMAEIRHTLENLGVRFDAFFSEQSLIDDRRVPELIEQLRAKGFVVDRDGAVFFKVSETAEEDKDRVLRKSSGDYTYFASDIAYHKDKLDRGYARLIDVWGADHHGYIARMRASLEALGLPKASFEVLLMQMVSLVKDGQPYRMSKSSGTFVTIDEVIDEIDAAAGQVGAGRDALRFLLLSRSSDSPMEIDIDLAKRQSVENPVFYAQYSHARMCQILERAETAPEFEAARRGGALFVPTRFDAVLAARLTLDEEKELLSLCDRLPEVVAEAAEHRAPHRIAFYVTDIAQKFASYYTRLQKLYRDAILPQRALRDGGGDWSARWDWEKTRARLMWLSAIRQVYSNALQLLGVDAPRRMAKLPEDSRAGDTDEAVRES